jgi:hypothetical protein
MLCVATPSIVVPLERLDGPRSRPNGETPGHPSRDWERFEQAKSSLDRLFDLPFRGSPLWPNTDSGSWSFGELSDVSNGPDSWMELVAPKHLGPDKKAKTVLLHVRNALAHGAYKFNFLAVAPADFHLFLHNWLEFLQELKLPEDMVSESSEGATYAS